MSPTKVKHVVLFGDKYAVQYHTSRALDFQGYPVQKLAENLRFWHLLKPGNWKYLRYVARHNLWFRQLWRIALYLPYQEPPQQYMDGLERVHVEVVEVEIQ